MVRYASLFSQVLSLIDRNAFVRHVRDLNAERRLIRNRFSGGAGIVISVC